MMTRGAVGRIGRVGRLLSRLRGLVGRQQSHDQPDQLTGGEHERPLLAVGAHLMICASVGGGRLWVAPPDGVCCLTAGVAEQPVARARQGGASA
jgi:hypothetical protein